jgi:hypothetical protein
MCLDYDDLLHADESALRRLAVFAGVLSADEAETLTASELRSALVRCGVADGEHQVCMY